MNPLDETTAVETSVVPESEKTTIAQERNAPKDLMAPMTFLRKSAPQELRLAGDIAYTTAGVLVILIVASAIIVSIAWFVFDITHLQHTLPPGVTDSSVFMRNQIISAVTNLMANFILVLILVEILNDIVIFFRTRKISPRPIVLLPLYVLMRGIILLGNTMLTYPFVITNNNVFSGAFVQSMLEMAGLSIAGLLLSASVYFLRDIRAKKTK